MSTRKNVIKFKTIHGMNGDDIMMATAEAVRIKPILPTPTLNSRDSESVLAEVMKPISNTRKEELRALRMFFKDRKR